MFVISTLYLATSGVKGFSYFSCDHFIMSVLPFVPSSSCSQGYFQLKAYPGAWTLSVRQGRSAEIYEIERYVQLSSITRCIGSSSGIVCYLSVEVLRF